MKNETIRNYLFLYGVFFLYSLSGVCSKFAALADLFSMKFILLYALSLFTLFLYAICWQKILKRMTLFRAFIHKPVTILLGIFWGRILFHETITPGMVLGVVIIMLGIYTVVHDND